MTEFHNSARAIMIENGLPDNTVFTDCEYHWHKVAAKLYITFRISFFLTDHHKVKQVDGKTPHACLERMKICFLDASLLNAESTGADTLAELPSDNTPTPHSSNVL